MKNNILYLLLFVSIAIRIFGIAFEKKWFSHDESVTFMCASGKQAAYENFWKNNSGSNLAPAQKWKDFYVPDEFWNFKQISQGLALTDIHPPLFFWILHSVVCLAPLQPYTGLVVNLFFSLLLLLATYNLAHYLSKDKNFSLLVCTIWFLSPAVNQIDFEARHYELLGLIAILFTTVSLKLVLENDKKNKSGLYIVLIVLTTAGLLTHYYFSLILLGAMISFLWKYGLKRETIVFYFALLLGLFSFLLLFPEFFDFISVFQNNLSHGGKNAAPLLSRLQTLFVFSADFFAYGKAGKIILILLSCMAFYLFVKLIKTDKFYFLKPNSTNEKQLFLLYFLKWNVFFTVVLYLLKISPGQAVGEQYYSYIWPLLAIALVWLFRAYNFKQQYIYLFLFILLVSSFFSTLKSSYLLEEFSASWFEKANQSELLILNNHSRGYLPRTTYFLRSDLPVLTGNLDEKSIAEACRDKKTISFFDQSLPDNQTIAIHSSLKEAGYTEIEIPNSPSLKNPGYRFFIFEKR